MAAKDYIFLEGCFGNVYLAKRNKSKKLMSTDRRLVTDNEIIGMFEKYLKRRCRETGDNTLVITDADGHKIFEATLAEKTPDENEN